LGFYGLRSLLAAFKAPAALKPEGEAPEALAKTLLICLAFTFLNPHVYLDTVVLMGSVSVQFPGDAVLFWLGGSTGSFAFFFALGYGAVLLRPLFENPKAWQLLDGVIWLVMWAIAARLLGVL
jgi:L-lysine exporter family protein LysE/ArgO